MPAFPDMTPRDLNQLLAYLQNPGKANVLPDVLAGLDGPKQTLKDSEGRTRYLTGYGYMNSSTGLAAIGPPRSTIWPTTWIRAPSLADSTRRHDRA